MQSSSVAVLEPPLDADLSLADTTAPPPSPPRTGQTDIDAALARLADLDQIAVAEHPARLAHVHQVLRAVLRETSVTARR